MSFDLTDRINLARWLLHASTLSDATIDEYASHKERDGVPTATIRKAAKALGFPDRDKITTALERLEAEWEAGRYTTAGRVEPLPRLPRTAPAMGRAPDTPTAADTAGSTEPAPAPTDDSTDVPDDTDTDADDPDDRKQLVAELGLRDEFGDAFAAAVAALDRLENVATTEGSDMVARVAGTASGRLERLQDLAISERDYAERLAELRAAMAEIASAA